MPDAFITLHANDEYAFLLDREHNLNNRFSVMGAAKSLVSASEIADVLKELSDSIENDLTDLPFDFRPGLVGETAITTSAVGSSSSTTITLTTALSSALVVGTEVGYIAANGQYVQTGSFVSAAAAAGATSVTINQTIAVPGSVTAIPGGSTIVFTQYPEMLVKLNFGTHSYYTGTAV
jgi:hypothetical protein